MAMGGTRMGPSCRNLPTTRRCRCHRHCRRRHCRWSPTRTTSKGTPPHGPTVPSDKSPEEHGDGPHTEPCDVGQQHQHALSPLRQVSLHPHCSSYLVARCCWRAQAQPFLAEARSSAVMVIVLNCRGGAVVPYPPAKAAGPYSCTLPCGTYSRGSRCCHQRCHH